MCVCVSVTLGRFHEALCLALTRRPSPRSGPQGKHSGAPPPHLTRNRVAFHPSRGRRLPGIPLPPPLLLLLLLSCPPLWCLPPLSYSHTCPKKRPLAWRRLALPSTVQPGFLSLQLSPFLSPGSTFCLFPSPFSKVSSHPDLDLKTSLPPPSKFRPGCPLPRPLLGPPALPPCPPMGKEGMVFQEHCPSSRF